MTVPWSTRAVDVGEVTLVFDEWPGPGPPVLFLHATGFARGVWRPAARRLIDACRPIALDMRGHGASSKPPPPYRWPLIVDDLLRLIERMRWRELVICGHSLGGAVGIEIAVERPELVSALVLVEAPLMPPSGRARATTRLPDMQARALKRTHRWASRRVAAEHLRARAPYDSWDAEVFEGFVDTGLVDARGRVELACPPEVEASVFAEARNSTAYDHLSRLQCPVWLGRGTGDRGLPSTTSPEAASRIPRVTEDVAEGGGHFVPLKKPEWVAGLICAALAGR